MVSRIVVSLKPASTTAPKTIDPSDLKTLTDYFHNALVRDLKPVMQVVEQPGPGVLVIRIALTGDFSFVCRSFSTCSESRYP